MLLAAAATACQVLGDLDRIVAIELVGSPARTVEEGDTLTLVARALSAAGALVPDAEIRWQVLDTGQVGFTLDSLSGVLVGQSPGTWRVHAVLEQLRAGPVSVTVTAAPEDP